MSVSRTPTRTPSPFRLFSDSESYLEEWVREQGLEMDERDNEFAATVRDEFMNQTPLYPEAGELSDREP
jgi:hypothetical protein